MEVYVKDGEDYAPLSDDYTVLKQDELESNYYTKDQLGDEVEKRVKSRFKNHVNLDEAHENETVVARVLETHGGSDGPDEDALRQQWETAHVKPLKSKLTEAEEKAAALEASVKHNQLAELLTSKDVGFSKSFVTRPEPGKPSPAELYFGDKFTLDENTSLAGNGTSTPPIDIAKELAANEAYQSFLAPESRNDSGAGRPGQDQGGAPASKGLKQGDLQGPAMAEYIEKYGYIEPKVDGHKPYKELPK